jgi:hypothetical protein
MDSSPAAGAYLETVEAGTHVHQGTHGARHPQAFAVPVGASRKGPWRMSQVKWVVFAVPGRYFESLGLIIPWTSND